MHNGWSLQWVVLVEHGILEQANQKGKKRSLEGRLVTLQATSKHHGFYLLLPARLQATTSLKD